MPVHLLNVNEINIINYLQQQKKMVTYKTLIFDQFIDDVFVYVCIAILLHIIVDFISLGISPTELIQRDLF